MKKKERKERRKGESEEGREGGKGRREGIFKGLPRVLRPSSLRVGGVLSMEGCCSGKNFQGRTCSRKHSCPTTFGRCISEKHGHPTTVLTGLLCGPHSLVPALCRLLGRMQDPSGRPPWLRSCIRPPRPSQLRGSPGLTRLLPPPHSPLAGASPQPGPRFLPAAPMAAPLSLPRVCPTLNLLHF